MLRFVTNIATSTSSISQQLCFHANSHAHMRHMNIYVCVCVSQIFYHERRSATGLLLCGLLFDSGEILMAQVRGIQALAALSYAIFANIFVASSFLRLICIFEFSALLWLFLLYVTAFFFFAFNFVLAAASSGL